MPGARAVTDPDELSLIGDGLPIIHGVSLVAAAAVLRPLCTRETADALRVGVLLSLLA